MKRSLVAAMCIVLAPAVPAASHAESTCKPPRDLPQPSEFPPAGPLCKNKMRLNPWVGTPECEPGVFQCVLDYYTCRGAKTVHSNLRSAGDGMCDDYWAAHATLGKIEICCDPPTRKRKQ
jgi:hypothetical protein